MWQAVGMTAYSVDLRKRIVAAVERGISRRQVAEVFGVSLPSIKRYLRQKRQRGALAPKPRPGRTPKIIPEQYPELEAQLRTHDTATLGEHVRMWRESRGVSLSMWAMRRAIERVGWTRKKGVWAPASATRPSAPDGASR